MAVLEMTRLDVIVSVQHIFQRGNRRQDNSGRTTKKQALAKQKT